MTRASLRIVEPETTGSVTPKQDRPATDPRSKGWFKPGRSGNPAGRPKGTRHKLSQQFFDDMLTCWLEGGPEALRRVRDEYPVEYMKLLAKVISKDAGTDRVPDPLDEMTDEQLAEGLDAVREFLAAHANDGEVGGN